MVTGRGARLGKLIVERLAGQGAHVVIAYLDSEARLVVADEIQQWGGRATFVQTDMSEERKSLWRPGGTG